VRSDLRQTWRSLLRSPRHVATVVLCLTIGITASVAVFSIVNSLLYGDIPGIVNRIGLARLFVSYEQAYGSESVGREGFVSGSAFSVTDLTAAMAQADPSITGWAGEGDMSFAVLYRGQPVGTRGAFVSRDYFEVLGTQPFHSHGRLLGARDDAPGAPPAAVIGYHLWRERFGGDPGIVGQLVLIGGRSYTVVGIAPPRFTGLQPADVGDSSLNYTQLWLPMRDAAAWPGAPSPMSAWLTVRARLAPGKTLDDARGSLQAVAARIATAHPAERRNASLVVSRYGFGPGDGPLQVLILIALVLAVPLSVLAIACANVANLQLARATERARELAVRLAIGASRGQIVRLLCLESLALSVLATATGWFGAAAALGAAQDLFPMQLSLDVRVLAFALVLAVGVTMLSGLAPAWIVTRRSMVAGLQQSGRAGGLAHTRLRSTLVVVQIAGSLVLLVMAGMFVQSVRAMRATAPPELKEQVVATFDLDMLNYSQAERTQFVSALTGRLAAEPRVRAVSVERMTGFRYRRVGGDATASPAYSDGGFITPSWVETTGVRLLAGRALRAEDGQDAALVNERLGRTVAVGESLEVSTSADVPARVVRVVGIVSDIRRSPDHADVDEALYLPLPAAIPAAFVVRLRTSEPAGGAEYLRDVLRAVDPRLPWERVESAEARYLHDVGGIHVLSLSVAGFGGVAMVLAAAGLFAVTAYVVSLRTREIGIRVAIGAARQDIVRLVLRQSLRLATIGVIAGVSVAVPLAVAMRAVFVGASPFDPLALIPPVILMFVVALAAAALPARRAASIDPVRALRAE